MTYNKKYNKWIVPIHIQLSHLLKTGKQPICTRVDGHYNANAPDGGSG